MDLSAARRVLTRPLLVGVVTGLVYAVILRGIAQLRWSSVASVMTLSFLFFSPAVLGFLTVRPHPSPGWLFRIFVPWLPAMASLTFFFVVGWEGAICVVMALPVMLPMASLGGILGGIRALRRPSAGLAAAMLPLALTPLERGFPTPPRVHRLESAVTIAAPPAAVWEQIVEVPVISEAEQRPALYTRLGFPRPVSATIDRRAVGGVRRARFERGVLFLETVTHFEPLHRLRFTIAAQTDSIPPGTLDEHVTIGGPYFDVLTGEYTIEQRPDGGVVLHLASELRLSTHFDFYAALWVDSVMRSIQENILGVVRARAEQRSLGTLQPRRQLPRGETRLGAGPRRV
jgi:uncharacterized protein YndB with AHSA1/START domain